MTPNGRNHGRLPGQGPPQPGEQPPRRAGGEPLLELAEQLEQMPEVRRFFGKPPGSECEVWVERIRGEGWKVGGTTGNPEDPPQLLDEPMTAAAEVLDALSGVSEA